jgi:hypothetical protein
MKIMNDKLNAIEKAEITIQSSLQLIPYIGGALASAYFGTKQEKRFKRIESFYQELAEQIQNLKLQFSPITSHDEEKLIALIEELNEKIEREHSQKKRNYFKKYLISTLATPTDNNFDERRYFLDTLFNMTTVECILLVVGYESYALSLKAFQDDKDIPIDPYVFVGAVNRLKNYGFLKTNFKPTNFDGIYNSFDEIFSITDFGRRFVEYCLKEEA